MLPRRCFEASLTAFAGLSFLVSAGAQPASAPVAPPPATTAPLASAPPVTPEERARRAPLFSLYFENDFFGGTDRHYTSGAKFSWLTRDLTDWGRRGWQQRVLEALPFVNREGGQKAIGFALGQNIYTPQNTDVEVPDPNDRPYAGWSYASFSFVSRDARRMDTFELQVGIVGPDSGAEAVQRGVHDWINDSDPRGWDHQLENEVGVNLLYERKWRLIGRALGGAMGIDLIPHAGFSLGNVATHANAGGTARLGFNLPSDFGPQLIGPPGLGGAPLDDRDPRVAPVRRWSLFVFGGVDGRAVARNLFLDGNTWEDSPSVDKEPLVGDLFYGVGFVVRSFQLTFTQVMRTREFEAQPVHNDFGSVTLSWTF